MEQVHLYTYVYNIYIYTHVLYLLAFFTYSHCLCCSVSLYLCILCICLLTYYVHCYLNYSIYVFNLFMYAIVSSSTPSFLRLFHTPGLQQCRSGAAGAYRKERGPSSREPQEHLPFEETKGRVEPPPNAFPCAQKGVVFEKRHARLRLR